MKRSRTSHKTGCLHKVEAVVELTSTGQNAVPCRMHDYRCFLNGCTELWAVNRKVSLFCAPLCRLVLVWASLFCSRAPVCTPLPHGCVTTSEFAHVIKLMPNPLPRAELLEAARDPIGTLRGTTGFFVTSRDTQCRRCQCHDVDGAVTRAFRWVVVGVVV
jgi:hypothetical protein